MPTDLTHLMERQTVSGLRRGQVKTLDVWALQLGSICGCATLDLGAGVLAGNPNEVAISWAIATILVLLAATVYGDMSRAMPFSGADLAYFMSLDIRVGKNFQRGFGWLLARSFAITCVLVLGPCAGAVTMKVLKNNLWWIVAEDSKDLMAFALLIALVFFHCFGFGWSIQLVGAPFQLFTSIFLMVAGTRAPSVNQNIDQPEYSLGNIAFNTLAILYMLDGWAQSTVLAEEIDLETETDDIEVSLLIPSGTDRQQVLSRRRVLGTMLSAVSLASIINGGVVFAQGNALGWTYKFEFGVASRTAIAGGFPPWIASVGVAISAIVTLNATLTACSRLLLFSVAGCSHNEYPPQLFENAVLIANVNRYGVPWVAVLVISIFIGALTLFSRKAATLLHYTGCSAWIFYALGSIVALIHWSRQNSPYKQYFPSGFGLFAYPLTPIVLIATCITVIASSSLNDFVPVLSSSIVILSIILLSTLQLRLCE